MDRRHFLLGSAAALSVSSSVFGSPNDTVRVGVIGVGGHDWPRNLGIESETTAEVIWRFFDAQRPQAVLRAPRRVNRLSQGSYD